jgi:hypothetical protein
LHLDHSNSPQQYHAITAYSPTVSNPSRTRSDYSQNSPQIPSNTPPTIFNQYIFRFDSATLIHDYFLYKNVERRFTLARLLYRWSNSSRPILDTILLFHVTIYPCFQSSSSAKNVNFGEDEDRAIEAALIHFLFIRLCKEQPILTGTVPKHGPRLGASSSYIRTD